MENNEIRQKLLTSYPTLPQNQGYFILDETQHRAVGYSPTAPNPIVIWNRDNDGDYFNGDYGNTLNIFELDDLKFLGINTDKVVSILNDIGFDYQVQTTPELPSLSSIEKELILLNGKFLIELDKLQAKYLHESPNEMGLQFTSPHYKTLVASIQRTSSDEYLHEIYGLNKDELRELGKELSETFHTLPKIQPTHDPSKKTIYVCSPLAGEIETNIRKAREYSKFVAQQGGTPIAPHITEIFDDLVPEERELGLSMGIDYLHKADELWVFGDMISNGMAAEIDIAKNELKIPIYHVDDKTFEKVPYNAYIDLDKKPVSLTQKLENAKLNSQQNKEPPSKSQNKGMER